MELHFAPRSFLLGQRSWPPRRRRIVSRLSWPAGRTRGGREQWILPSGPLSRPGITCANWSCSPGSTFLFNCARVFTASTGPWSSMPPTPRHHGAALLMVLMQGRRPWSAGECRSPGGSPTKRGFGRRKPGIYASGNSTSTERPLSGPGIRSGGNFSDWSVPIRRGGLSLCRGLPSRRCQPGRPRRCMSSCSGPRPFSASPGSSRTLLMHRWPVSSSEIRSRRECSSARGRNSSTTKRFISRTPPSFSTRKANGIRTTERAPFTTGRRQGRTWPRWK